MKKIFFSILLFFTYINNSFAGDGGVTGLPASQLKKGDITIDDIPNIIVNATDFFIGIAGTVAVIFIIIGAYKYLFGSLEGNTDRGKSTILFALSGFAIAALAYFIIRFIIDNFAG
ncbi:hypothetical protein BKN14_04330 [Candidatus Gracilibacteria bacterium HOT-871]|nr:hypothetical protein BKN14_04330 [Candidatus Gracilibacteria bacterium HOT-871]MBB1564978.1 hypothetical protein [Candidatus Gracilibacteria bacterium]RKW22535.1 MAG: hypothetical protein D8B46_05195 [Candidatus Gracilibacteria bacterium]